MLRAVLDANVYLSALLSPAGIPGLLIEAFLRDAHLVLVTSPAIVEETSRALRYPKVRKLLGPLVDGAAWFEGLIALADMVEDKALGSPVCKDPDDDKYLAAAVEGRCDFVVSGDRSLLAVGEFEGIRITTPRSFMTWLRTKGS